MTAWAYYNEFDPFAAATLRELIKDGLIAPGEVDERSIEDVTPNDVRSFRQCHFFAGFGVWSLAARLAGFRDDEALWSGSCSCQPFSAAGKGLGFADERHVWPAFDYLIEQCRPPIVVGEQVTGADGDAWFDLVSADLDAKAYAFGVAETCACGFGAPHKRSRNYWVAAALDRVGAFSELAHAGSEGPSEQRGRRVKSSRQSAPGAIGFMADDTSGGRREERPNAGRIAVGDSSQGRGARSGNGSGVDGLGDAPNEGGSAISGVRRGSRTKSPRGSATRKLDDPLGDRRGARRDYHVEHDGDELNATGQHGDGALDDAARPRYEPARIGEPEQSEGRRGLSRLGRAIDGDGRPGPVNGYWRDVDWLRCRDEKWRPVEPGTFPLVDAGTFRNRVGLLRGAGNAVNIAQAEGFLIAVRHALKLG